jgi:NAD-dependent protein deacetylase/lipoamidase
VQTSDLNVLAERLRKARRITVLTGAGVSAASGVPTFRGDGGLWKTHRAEDLATPEAFRRDPRLVWEWYDWRRGLIASCTPNPAHDALARLNGRPGFTLITQNVDGLHERAGSRDIVRFHGSIWQLKCADGCCDPWDDMTVPMPELPVKCPRCEALARPGVVWFGESIDEGVLRRATTALDCDLFLSSSLVYPAAGLVHAAKQHGAWTVEINPATTGAAAELDMVIAAPAEEILPRVIRKE